MTKTAPEEQDGEVVAGVPAYAKLHSMGEYVYDWSWAHAARQLVRHGALQPLVIMLGSSSAGVQTRRRAARPQHNATNIPTA